MTDPTRISVAYGDGIGPEIMTANLEILQKAGASLIIDKVEIGKHLYEKGVPAGIDDKAWSIIERNRVFLKAPITTPQGGGVKSLNVTVRMKLGLYANIRPCTAYYPYVPTDHPDMKVVIIRENEEGSYGGIEHQQTPEVVQCLKLVTLPGCERIIRYAFEYASIHQHKRVSCFTKDNIMKMTDGLFHRVFNTVAMEYPEIEAEHFIVDIGMALLAQQPERFDLVVVPNLYGDILSDIAAQIAGSVGMAGSSNIGEHYALFEAIHGSAPSIAGQDIANPSGLILASVMMLDHIGQHDVATSIHNAWLRTIEEGMHTQDIFSDAYSHVKLGTQAFAKAVIDRLGQKPQHLTPVDYRPIPPPKHYQFDHKKLMNIKRELLGIDIFLYKDPTQLDLEAMAKKLQEQTKAPLELTMISNRGSVVWPGSPKEVFCTDHWRCRFLSTKNLEVPQDQLIQLQTRLLQAGFDIIKTENLYAYDKKNGFTRGQGE